VTTKDNRVTLSGTVPTAAARTAALALARGIDGVRAVDDKLQVKP
jgi:osmotically-inducible protein OsmY